MPTYEYACTSCDHTFERFESITAKPNPLCPQCNKRKAKRNISGGGGLIFKGSGFYTTDYRSSSYSSDAKKDTSSTSDSSSSTSKSSSTKSTSESKSKSSKKKAEPVAS